MKDCLLDSAALICPEIKGAFEYTVSTLSRRIATRHIEDIAGNLDLYLKNTAPNFDCLSLALETTNKLLFVKFVQFVGFFFTTVMRGWQASGGFSVCEGELGGCWVGHR